MRELDGVESTLNVLEGGFSGISRSCRWGMGATVATHTGIVGSVRCRCLG